MKPERPTPEKLDCVFAIWDPAKRRYRLKTKARWVEDRCWALRCRHAPGKMSYFCDKCRKRISRLNNPIADRVSVIRQRAKRRGQEFHLTAADLEEALLKTGTWEAFMRAPDHFHVDRKNCLEGYTPDNIQLLPPLDNLRKQHQDKCRHREAKLKRANGDLPGLGDEVPDPFNNPF